MFAAPVLRVDLAAILANWQFLRAHFGGRECAAVVKADAYGLGAGPVAQALSAAGCHTFFVATIEEAIALRAVVADVRILVFHGVGADEEFLFIRHRLIPVLNSWPQIARWQAVAREQPDAISALHLDTGMNRLGVSEGEFSALLAREPQLLAACRVGLLLSHFACAPEQTHPLNRQQRDALQRMGALAPGIPRSLCNSAGIFLPPEFHCDLARPGCALYGIRAQDGAVNPLRHVAQWEAPILMLRTLEAAQSVGYGATQTLPKGARIATVASGYADGFLRQLTHRACGYIGAHKVPLAGRVSMDMLCFDVSAVPPQVLADATHVRLIGDSEGIRVDDLADAAGTIGYEIFTRIGPRVRREYLQPAS